MTLRIWPGRPYPLGATWDGTGVNFALFSENATGVDLCLFRDEYDADEAAISRLGPSADGSPSAGGTMAVVIPAPP